MRLLEERKKYAVSTEEEAKQAQEKFRTDAAADGYTILNSGYAYKCKKSKGEIVEEQYVVEVVKQFDTLWGN